MRMDKDKNVQLLAIETAKTMAEKELLSADQVKPSTLKTGPGTEMGVGLQVWSLGFRVQGEGLQGRECVLVMCPCTFLSL